MKIDVMQVPYDSGQRSVRMGAGPLHLVQKGLLDRLTEAGHTIRLVEVESRLEFATEISVAFELAATLAAAVRQANEDFRFPLVLAGNCISAVGTVAGCEGQPAVVWFDAHSDLNTPETSLSGYLDGMALSALIGRCWSMITRKRVGLKAVPERLVALVGTRDLDQVEREYLTNSPIVVLPSSSTDSALEDTLKRLEIAGAIYIHVDLDVLDPSVGRANLFAAPCGLQVEQVVSMIDRMGARIPIAAAALTAYDPSVDSTGSMLDAAFRIGRAIVDAASRHR